MFKTLIATALFGISLVATVAVASMQSGDTRKVETHGGVGIRTEPKPLAPRVGHAPYGEECTIIEVRGLWVYVDCVDYRGWARMSDFAPRPKLTGVKVTAPNSSSSDVSVAGRQ